MRTPNTRCLKPYGKCRMPDVRGRTVEETVGSSHFHAHLEEVFLFFDLRGDLAAQEDNDLPAQRQTQAGMVSVRFARFGSPPKKIEHTLREFRFQVRGLVG